MAAKQIKLMVLHDKAVLEFFWSVAWTYATLADLKIITTPLFPGVPAPVAGAQRVGSWTDSKPRVTALAVEYYQRLVLGLENRQAQGPMHLLRWIWGVALKKTQMRNEIQQVFAKVDKTNAQMLEFLESAAIVAATTNRLGSVVLAGAGTVVAVTAGAAAAAPAALVYLGYKVVGGLAPLAFENGSGVETAKGIAIGNYDNGVITCGEGVQYGTEKALGGLSQGYRNEMARQIKGNRQIVIKLNAGISRQTREIGAFVRARTSSPQNIGKAMYKNIVKDRVEVEAKKRAMQGASLAGQGMKFVATKGIPIVFFAHDAINSWSDWQSDMAKIRG